MGKSKKKKGKSGGGVGLKVGFVPDFSLYLDKHFPIEKVYNKPAFVEKLGNVLKELLAEDNPAFELQKKGFCNKFEKMSPSQDKDFFAKLSNVGDKVAAMYPYYSSFGNNGYGMVIYLDSGNRHAYFLALDVEHKIRKYHGKLG